MVDFYEFSLLREKIINLLSTLPRGDLWQNKFIFSALIFVAFIILAQFVKFIIIKYVEKIAPKTSTKVDDLFIEKTKHPIFLVIMALGLKLAVLNMNISSILDHLATSLLASLFVLLLSRITDVVIGAWGGNFSKKTATKLDDILIPIFHKTTKVIFVVISLIWILHIWEVNITPYLAGVGISGIVLGLALQDSLKNVFGGVSVILDRTFKVGERVRLESGEIGVIHDIGLRSTKITTPENEIIYVPNGYLANSRITNFAHPNPMVRISVVFGVAYGTKVNKVREVVLPILSKMEGVLNNPKPNLIFVEMGDFSLKFKANFWIENWETAYGKSKQSEATEKIYDALNKAKINIPFPTHTVLMKKE